MLLFESLEGRRFLSATTGHHSPPAPVHHHTPDHHQPRPVHHHTPDHHPTNPTPVHHHTPDHHPAATTAAKQGMWDLLADDLK